MHTTNTKTFFSYVIPSVLAFALSGVYTIVDGFFIGQSLGDIGLASITIGYPITAFIQAIGTGIGLSGAIRFTILNAQNEQEKKKECFSGTTLLMLLVSGLLTVSVFCFAKPLLSVLGAREDTLTLSVEYARIIALGAVFQILATGFVPFIRNMGGSSFSMVAMVMGFTTNIILDYAFVWVADWGTGGAALATIIGQAITMIASVIYFVVKKNGWKLPTVSNLLQLWEEVIKVAVSPFGLTFSPMITMLFMNRFLMMYGDEQAVAVYGCIGYVTTIIYLVIQGVGDGCQPLVSNDYGENNWGLVKYTRGLAYKTAAAITVLCMVGVYLAKAEVGILFGASVEANAGVSHYLSYFLAPLLLLAFVRITTSYFYATEKTMFSYILVYAEPLLTFALLLILPPVLKLTGVWLAVPFAQTVTSMIALVAKYYVDKQELSMV